MSLSLTPRLVSIGLAPKGEGRVALSIRNALQPRAVRVGLSWLETNGRVA